MEKKISNHGVGGGNNNIEIKIKAIVIKTFTGLRKRIEEHSENINKKLENVFKKLIRTEEYNNCNRKYTRKY